MKSCRWNINVIFCALAMMCLFSACETTGDKPKTAAEKKKEKEDAKLQTILKVHLEIVPDNKSDQIDVPVYRKSPVSVHIDTKEILNNTDLLGAEIVEMTAGGFGIRLAFDPHGARVLENVTARNAGKRLVIYTASPEIRYLAAPLITKRLGTGELIFTPDATREECVKLVRGINNVSKKIAKGSIQ